MEPILDLARSRDIAVIEDCAQAHGAEYRGKKVGSIGDIGAWSFCQDKIMTTGGEGGMVTLNDERLWRDMWAFKDHGKSWEAVYEREHPPGFRWLHETFGTNWRMLEMQGVIGRLQLKRLAAWREARTANAHAIARSLQSLAGADGPVRVPQVPGSATHAYYRFYCYVRPEKLAEGWSRDRIVSEINAAGVPCYQGSCSEIYLEQAFSGTPHRPSQPLPVATELGETSLMFLVHPTLTAEQVEKTGAVAAQVIGAAAR
jgi:dTDP-4-amino-4,6-dideoxygalactose transaminase